MKLVAKKDFFNVKNLSLNLDPKDTGKIDKFHVPKGFRFTIGTATVFKDLTQDQKVLVSQLMLSQCTVIDDEKSSESQSDIAKIDAEVAAEKAAAEKVKANTPLSVPEQIALGVAQALAQIKVAGGK